MGTKVAPAVLPTLKEFFFKYIIINYEFQISIAHLYKIYKVKSMQLHIIPTDNLFHSQSQYHLKQNINYVKWRYFSF